MTGGVHESLKQRYQQRIIRLRPLFPNVPDFIFEELLECKRVASFQLRVRVHAGPPQHLQAFIALHCNPYDTGEDPYKGGLQKGVDVTQEKIEGKAMNMTEKVGAFDLQLGGGKAGIILKPGFIYTPQDHAEIDRAFVVEADKMGMIGPRVYSTATDQGTTEFDSDCIAREYINLHEGELGSKRGVATGKSIECGGHPARKNATGRGGLIVLRKFLHTTVRLDSATADPTIVIDGFGNVGRPTFLLAREFGLRPLAVSDINGGIYNAHGLNVEDVLAYYEKHKTFVGYKDADVITTKELLGLPCDILIPAAAENRLTEDNADQVKARCVLELANGPTTTEAEKILTQNGTTIVPDVLANAGGVIVSWRELNNNKEHDRHSVELPREEKDTNAVLESIMEENTARVLVIHAEKKLSFRDSVAHL